MERQATAQNLTRPSTRALWSALVTLAVPFLLLLFNSRLVMTPLFLQFEYTRPGFPVDNYGMTTEERLEYAPYALDYLLYARDIRYLGDLHFDDGTSLFNGRELNHMRDVQRLTQLAFGLALAMAGLLLVIAYRQRRSVDFWQAVQRGSMLTLALIFSVVFLAILSWDVFFTGFHRLFFENDTWYFAYSDTLIRLFPEQFWFDAALLIGGLTSLEALALIPLCREMSSRLSQKE